MSMISADAIYSEYVARYKRYREFTRELQNHVLPEYLSKEAITYCSKELGVMRKDTLVLGQMDEIGVVMDYCIYDYRQERLNAVGWYIADSQLDPDSDKYTIVRAMSESFYTLVQVWDVLPEVGIRINDLLAEKEYLLIDMGFSQTAVKELALSTRLIPFDDFVMTSGAALPIDSKEMLLEIFNELLPQYGNTDGEYISFNSKQRADLTAAIIHLCLENDMSSQIKYEDVSDGPVVSPIRRENRIGRNEPCPCGSGRKYSRCCGR
jgi:hypothetical protein